MLYKITPIVYTFKGRNVLNLKMSSCKWNEINIGSNISIYTCTPCAHSKFLVKDSVKR